MKGTVDKSCLKSSNSSVSVNNKRISSSSSSSNNSSSNVNSTAVTFVHLDLGIGGAERLVVNLACSLIDSSASQPPTTEEYSVHIVTSHHDPNHCFDETKPSDGVLSQCIAVYGDWLPRSILGKAAALCAIIRMLYISMVIIIRSLASSQRTDVVVLDGVSAPIPLFYLAGIPVVFYCHYPDKLLCTDRAGLFKRAYRSVIDIIEEFTTGCATVIVVNSKFTAGAFHQSFPWISGYFEPKVLYPTVEADASPTVNANNESNDTNTSSKNSRTSGAGVPDEVKYTDTYDYVFVSLNRYERKKNIGLALDALAYVKKRTQTAVSKGCSCLLVIAGGYDKRVRENVEHLDELRRQAERLGLSSSDGSGHGEAVDVIFRTSISGAERGALLARATALLYTPDNEHFGIVPLEAMYAGTPVIAVASGGPLETVIHGRTGFLCAQDEKSFGEAMVAFTQPVSDAQRSELLTPASASSSPTDTLVAGVSPHTPHTLSSIMGSIGRSHVENNFTAGKMRLGLIECLESARMSARARTLRWALLIPIVVALLAVWMLHCGSK